MGDIIIDLGNATDFVMESIGDYASTNVTIHGESAHSITVNVEGIYAFTDSIIYGSSSSISLSCRSEVLDGQSCKGTELFLSRMEHSNAIYCHFGCQQLTLHFPEKLSTEIFESITIDECYECLNLTD